MQPIPTINVNLKQCDCEAIPDHAGWCSSTPVLIPCPFPPSVTFSVPLAECTFGCQRGPIQARPVEGHWAACPARPINVRCSVSGKTWGGSQLFDFHHADGVRFVTDAAVAACNARWALVKALVLGHTDLSQWITGPMAVDLLAQRDAVFSKLADLARLEQKIHARWLDLPESVRQRTVRTPFNPGNERTPSVDALGGFIQELIGLAGSLP